ncbi:bifunctional uridylyltransferase/uridylyl-removing protein GlnD [Parashewanella spongiae]|uniref:Bifunctional uridylyltransferase/uridylyl-removing enzyme n=1 Tax=Parashewanella spongiae TaxID=342950 RepID=A0A3A6UAU0_9GAMM|nr:bifunctional uridylyltransferase/uridylyl-removing protein GlnD [Parashewanella spongiae]MCL1076998.1 bifunctional uridylyltransferase/uridylyl-removing protein GlnD [Parashewanella spongiae]RJY19103.1 bifunctional uridylyltransferase/uridylyl-removing protein GlnD [Parashewanella spongiae]
MNNTAQEVKAALITQNEHLLDRFKRKHNIVELVQCRCDAVDSLLQNAWQQCGIVDHSIALIAVGGYGRGALHPHSDVDLLFLFDGELSKTLQILLETFIAYLWDVGLEIGHSVRTLEQSIQLGKDDLTIATALLEARLIAGDTKLFIQLQQQVCSPKFWPAQEFYTAKRQEQDERHEKSSAFNLEPNLKSCPGGLRDIQTITWVSMRHFNVTHLEDLVEHGFLEKIELAELIQCRNFLWDLRFALHIIAGRDENRLLFDFQRDVADLMGFEDATQLAVEQMMKRYYQTIRRVMELNQMLLQLFFRATLKQSKTLEVRPINKRYQRRGNFIEALPGVDFSQPEQLLELFAITLKYPSITGIFAPTLRTLRRARRLLTQPLMLEPACRKIFMEILRHPKGISALSLMHKHNIMSSYLPEWRKIEGQMQFDLFHAYTVDEHTHRLLKNLDRFFQPEFKDEFPLASIVANQLPKRGLLVLAAIFHDIGKGRGGDHSILGSRDAEEFCKLHELNDHDGRIVCWLVEQHLLMSTVAQRRDISDPDVIVDFADKVRDNDHLNYLYCLTVADIRATNENIWNSWKDSLLKDLYFSTQRVLTRGKEKPIDMRARVREHQAKAKSELIKRGVTEVEIEKLWQTFNADYFLRHNPNQVVWHTSAILKHGSNEPLVQISKHMSRGGTEVFVYCENRPKLFATVMAILDNKNISINDANIMTSKIEYVLDTFIILERTGKTVSSSSRIQSLQRTLSKALKTNTTNLPKFKKISRKMKSFTVKTKVTFLPSTRNGTTMMELITLDRPGLLAKVADIFYQCDVTIVGAKISTIGERAEDFFRLKNNAGQPLSSSQKEELKQALIKTLTHLKH